MAVKGVDVSGHQGDIDWRKVRAAGYRFGFIKLTEGKDFVDKSGTRARWDAMGKAGIIRGAYHFARPQRGRDPKVEARHFWSRAKAVGWKRGRDLPLVLDAETDDNTMNARQLHAWCEGFCKEIKRLSGRGCIVYTGHWWRDNNISGAIDQGGILWLAAYTKSPGPFVPRSWRTWTFWQHSQTGRVPGVRTNCDVNLYNGSLAKLQLLARGRGTAKPPKPKPSKPKPPAKPSSRKQRTKRYQHNLRKIGFKIAADGVAGPATRQAVSDFKRGYAWKPGFDSFNGNVGPVTYARIEKVANKLGGRASEHFTYREFASKRTGKIRVHRDLVRGLEALRRLTGPISILSGYRDYYVPGQASNSQHKYGNAIDPAQQLPATARVAALKVFSGIGYQGSTGRVRHVDVRHVGPNTTGGSPSRPTIWRYGA